MASHEVVVHTEGRVVRLTVAPGANLRRVLLDAGLSPYGRVSEHANCGGRGLCATCGVWLRSREAPPDHWHDKLAHRFGYPRLSCQITVDGALTIHLLADKLIWGRRSTNPERPRRGEKQALD